MKYQQKVKQLANGLTVLTVPMETESVTAVLLVRVGSRDEEKKVNGLSHFVEHMVFKGTQKWPTAQEVNKVIDSVGGAFNAFTSWENTGFWMKVAKKHLNLGLEFLGQLIFKPRLPEPELERERGVILEEIKMRQDEPMIKVSEAFVSQVYSLTCLGQEVIGTAENIKAIPRTEFIKHLNKWYQPKNMVLAVAGGIDKSIDDQVRSVFSKPGTGKVKLTDKPAKLVFKQDQPEVQAIEKKIEQAHFCLGVRTFERINKDRYVLAVLNTILGGNTSSRLWNEIRENRGLAYYVRSSIDSFFETGYLVTQAGCDVKKLNEAIKLTLNEYEKIGRKPVEDKELKLAKEYLKGRLALALEDSLEVAEQFGGDLLLEGKVRTIQEMLEGVNKVKTADIQRVGGKIFQKRQLNLTIVGPFKNQNQFAKLLV